MLNISNLLNKIKNAVYGEEVRNAIHDLLQAINIGVNPVRYTIACSDSLRKQADLVLTGVNDYQNIMDFLESIHVKRTTPTMQIITLEFESGTIDLGGNTLGGGYFGDGGTPFGLFAFRIILNGCSFINCAEGLAMNAVNCIIDDNINGVMIENGTSVLDGFALRTASGEGSHAEGYYTKASGKHAHAEGQLTHAQGVDSHAEGQVTAATGDASHSEGGYTVAIGAASHSEGNGTTAYGANSHAEGNSATSNGNNSHAEGMGSTANGPNSHAEGYSTLTVGDGSHAEGYSTVASNTGSHSEGGESNATGVYAHAEGGSTLASGDAAHSEGSSSTASGNSSHAEGIATIANAYASHSEGFYTKAIGDNCHAEGSNTLSGGKKFNVVSVDLLSKKLFVSEYSDLTGLSIGDKVVQNRSGATFTGNTITAISQIEKSITLANDPMSTNTYGYTFWVPTKPESGDVIRSNSAHVEGDSNKAGGHASHAEGYGNRAYGDKSHAEGWGNTVTGTSAHAEGSNHQVTADDAHAEGYMCVVSDRYGHVEGYRTTVNKSAGHAEGSNTIVSGDSAHAEGNGSAASGNNSHAEGEGTQSIGAGSHSEGNASVAKRAYEHVQASGCFAASGDAQYVRKVYLVLSTTAVATPLASLILDANMTYLFRGLITARDSAGNSAAFEIKCLAKKGLTNGTILMSQFVKTPIGVTSWDIAVATDVNTGSLIFNVTGAAATNIRWVGEIEFVQVGY